MKRKANILICVLVAGRQAHSLSAINIQRCVSQTQQNVIMFIIVLGKHISILIESSSDPSKKTGPYLEMFP